MPKKPSTARHETPSAKARRERSEAPTIPPPPKNPKRRKTLPRTSGIKVREERRPGPPGASVDEVVADLSKDPRRERD